MRLWTISPRYLDSAGLVALWRESLLAKKVLEGKTVGYRNHPQLVRFKNSENPLGAINKYLEIVYKESQNRGFNFDHSKFKNVHLETKIEVSLGQVEYEYGHLKIKLKERSPDWLRHINGSREIEVFSLFNVIEGPVETWEVAR